SPRNSAQGVRRLARRTPIPMALATTIVPPTAAAAISQGLASRLRDFGGGDQPRKPAIRKRFPSALAGIFPVKTRGAAAGSCSAAAGGREPVQTMRWSCQVYEAPRATRRQRGFVARVAAAGTGRDLFTNALGDATFSSTAARVKRRYGSRR